MLVHMPGSSCPVKATVQLDWRMGPKRYSATYKTKKGGKVYRACLEGGGASSGARKLQKINF